MDLLIPDNWLREFLKTKATAKEVAKCLSLSGPSVEKIIKSENGDVYSIEVTTNRMDSASVYGIAREASAILPRFNKKAKLISLETNSSHKFVNKVKYLNAKVDSKLCPRFTTVLIRNVKLSPSPSFIQKRLTDSGIRPINNVIDISNYIMLEIGQPVHTFDYDKIKDHVIILRESKKGEKVTTLDDKTYTLSGEDIVIEDGSGKLIDLCGIMGGALSAVDETTSNVLLFVQNYNPANIRKTSMTLAKRSEAAMLFEKKVDPELVGLGISRASDMFIKLTNGTPEKEILDLHPNPYRQKSIKVSLEEIGGKLGIQISKKDILNILYPLGFVPSWKKNILKVKIPSFRDDDINISEDIIEEIARIYGYHNLPSAIMEGVIPDKPTDSPFPFEDKIKDILKGYGGVEIYTLSLTNQGNLKLKNPLNFDAEYLRTTLMKSIEQAAKDNSRERNPFHIFEIANVYIPKADNLPDEKMTLAGIFANTNFREAKGVIESLLNELNIKIEFIQEDLNQFIPNQRIVVKVDRKVIGQLGNLENEDFIYYEFDLETINSLSKIIRKYAPIPQNPPQIEDITLTIPEKTYIGDVISLISQSSPLISKVELTDTFENAYTFNVEYQHSAKNLTDKEVEKIRSEILTKIKSKFGGALKS